MEWSVVPPRTLEGHFGEDVLVSEAQSFDEPRC